MFDSESGTTIQRTSLWLVFAFCNGLSIELRSIIRRERLTFGPARQARCSTPSALVRVRAPLFREPALVAGSCFWFSPL
jgi:hypothetical protein